MAFTLLKLDGGGFLKLILDMASKWLLTCKELSSVHKKKGVEDGIYDINQDQPRFFFRVEKVEKRHMACTV